MNNEIDNTAQVNSAQNDLVSKPDRDSNNSEHRNDQAVKISQDSTDQQTVGHLMMELIRKINPSDETFEASVGPLRIQAKGITAIIFVLVILLLLAFKGNLQSILSLPKLW